MGLTAALMRAAAARPRVLLVTSPGGTAVRLAVEAELRSRDWPLASTPAGADVMVVAGPDCPRLRSALGRLWQDMPQPRAYVRATTADDVPALLDAGRACLSSPDRQRAEARTPGCEDEGPSGRDDEHREGCEGEHREEGQAESGHGRSGGGPRDQVHRESGSGDLGSGGEHRSGGVDHEGHEGHEGSSGGEHRSGGADHEGHHGGPGGERRNADADPQGPQGPQGHGGHGGHGGHHGSGDMEMPGGVPMAEPGEDRDGLTLDRLHLPLGPVLADWPAGLVIRVVLQGDVIQQADLGELSAGRVTDPFWARPWILASAGEPVAVGEAVRRRAAARLDSLGRLLSVAGWPAEAVTARRLRDDLLEEAPSSVVLGRSERFARRVGRSRTLYWLTRGIGPVSTADARAAGVSGPAARAGGDVPARYRQWLTEVLDDVRALDSTAPLDPVAWESPRGRWDAERPPSAALAGLLPGLLVGAELGAARLVVASLDPDPDELSAPSLEAARG
ncbi:hypothetical protein [Streptomyces sp. NPDC007020]|uniref:hypothetical protein n=1 Tax=Streptomyces sp. NPDC007020 TaxID=3154585 RepID=UPI0033C25B58